MGQENGEKAQTKAMEGVVIIGKTRRVFLGIKKE